MSTQMSLRCNPEYISFSRIFPSCYIWVHLVFQMYVNVICTFSLRCLEMSLFAKCMKMYLRCTLRCTSDVHLDFPEWRFFFPDDDVRKCTKMYKNVHLDVLFPNVLQMYIQMYPRCTPHSHSFHSRPIAQWSVLNSCCEYSLRLGVIFSWYLYSLSKTWDVPTRSMAKCLHWERPGRLCQARQGRGRGAMEGGWSQPRRAAGNRWRWCLTPVFG